jgi:hypothetical protein
LVRIIRRRPARVARLDRITNLGDNHSAGHRIQGFGQRFGADAELANPVLIDLDPQALHRLVPVEIDQPRIWVLPDGLPDLDIAALIFRDPPLPRFAHRVAKAPPLRARNS